eukprot:jgi/Chlat1/6881/Chrsp51S06547
MAWTAGLARLSQMLLLPVAASAAGASVAIAESRNPVKIGEFSGSGFVFKDTIEVTAFPDPKTSVSCTQSGPIRILEPIALGVEGEEVFTAKRNLLFKVMHVRRIYDEANHALVYVAYSTRLSQDMSEQNSRYRTSISTISLYGQNVDVKRGSK